MEYDGWLEVVEQIDLRILRMESHGLHPLLELRCSQVFVMQSHGMEHYGLLEEMEQINLPIL
jgi:hypothetical protein